MTRIRLVIAGTLIFAAAATLPAHAASRTSGSGTATCADGTVNYSPTTLWPPNHKMQTITISYTAPADLPGDTTTITVGPIVDSQANADGSGEAPGSGQPTAMQGLDWSGTNNSATSAEGSTATTSAQVRSERSGTISSGRTYTITVMCSEKDAVGMMSDPSGQGMAMLTVTVPHDQGH